MPALRLFAAAIVLLPLVGAATADAAPRHRPMARAVTATYKVPAPHETERARRHVAARLGTRYVMPPRHGSLRRS